MTVDELSAKYMVPVRRGIMSLFMTRDGESVFTTCRGISSSWIDMKLI